MHVMGNRMRAADTERQGSEHVCQISNGDRTNDGSPLLEAKFHKTLPHNSLGQVRGQKCRGCHPPRARSFGLFDSLHTAAIVAFPPTAAPPLLVVLSVIWIVAYTVVHEVRAM